MNNKTYIFLAMAIATLALTGCSTYPAHRAYYRSRHVAPTYVTPQAALGTTYVAPAAVGTSTIYVEEPYYYDDGRFYDDVYYRNGGYYYYDNGGRRDRRTRGRSHRHGANTIKPHRRTYPSRHVNRPKGVNALNQAAKSAQIKNSRRLDAVNRVSSAQARTVQQRATQQRAARQATQQRAARQAAQQRAARQATQTQRRAVNAQQQSMRARQSAVRQSSRSSRRLRK